MRPRPRFAAWLYTGPVGHLYAGAADTVVLLVRYRWAKARGRLLCSRGNAARLRLGDAELSPAQRDQPQRPVPRGGA